MYSKRLLATAVAAVLCAPLTSAFAPDGESDGASSQSTFQGNSSHAPRSPGRAPQIRYTVVDTLQNYVALHKAAAVRYGFARHPLVAFGWRWRA